MNILIGFAVGVAVLTYLSIMCDYASRGFQRTNTITGWMIMIPSIVICTAVAVVY